MMSYLAARTTTRMMLTTNADDCHRCVVAVRAQLSAVAIALPETVPGPRCRSSALAVL